MRLYLSSFRLGNCPQRLVELAGANRRAAVVINACDYYTNAERSLRVHQEISALEELGFSAFELDLRCYFGKQSGQADLPAALAGCGLVWVRGGNAFVLRRAMKATGFDLFVKQHLERDAFVYGGYSAGVDMLAPSLRGVELVDDSHAVPTGYDPVVIWEGLGILPYVVAPHYRSDHPESTDIERFVQYCIDHHLLFKALRDGEVIVIDGTMEEILGAPN
jgi:dipeptidase E